MPERSRAPKNLPSRIISPQNGMVENMRDLHYRFLGMARMESLAVEVGRALAALVVPGHSDGLLEKTTALRRQLAFELGLVVPGIRFSVSENLPAHQYSIKIFGVEVSGGELHPDRLLAVPNLEKKFDVGGQKATEPIYGAPAVWIQESDEDKAIRAGAGVYDPASVVVIHLTEIIRRNAADLLGRQEVRYLIDFLAQDYPDLVAAVTPQPLSLGEVRGVLQSLLREQVSIRDLVTIFEALADIAAQSRFPLHLVEGTRLALARQIRQQHASASNIIDAICLHPDLEKVLLDAASRSGQQAQNSFSPLDPALAARLMPSIAQAIYGSLRGGHRPVLVVHPNIRLFMHRLLEPAIPVAVVLSWTEVITHRKRGAQIRVLCTLQMDKI